MKDITIAGSIDDRNNPYTGQTSDCSCCWGDTDNGKTGNPGFDEMNRCKKYNFEKIR